MIEHHNSADRELVRGVLWPGFLGKQLPEWLRHELKGGLAGAVYFAQNLDATDAAQPASLSRELRAANPLALIGIDEEGGNVTRLEAGLGSTLPGAAQLGFADSVEATRAVGAELARRAVAAGVSVVLAPTADVNTNPMNPVIGVRSFGSDDTLVARHAAAMTEGIQSVAGDAASAVPFVAACAKHYPGHGDTHLDSHHALPTAATGWQQLQAEHGAPFAATIAADVRAIMTAHIRVDDRGDLPATLNPEILGELRAQGFTGVIVTDALDMAAVAREYGTGRGAVLALVAGADLLCIGNPANPGNEGDSPDHDVYLEVFTAILEALESGELPRERLSEAVARVRALAEETRVGESAASIESAAAASVSLSEARAQEIARAGFTIHGAIAPLAGPVAVLDLRGRITWAVATVSDALTNAINELDNASTARRVRPSDLSEAVEALASVAATENLVLLVDRIAADGPQREALTSVLDALGTRPAVVVNVGLPSELELPVARIDTRADSRVSARVVASLLREGGAV